MCYLSSESLFQLQGKRANPLAIGPAREEPDAGGGRHGRVPAADGGGRAPEDTNGGRFKLTPGLCNGSRICVQCISVGVVIKMTHIRMVLFLLCDGSTLDGSSLFFCGVHDPADKEWNPLLPVSDNEQEGPVDE